MSKKTVSSSSPISDNAGNSTKKDRKSFHNYSERKSRESTLRDDPQSDRSASPPEKRRKRHKRATRERSASYSPKREDKDTEKDRDSEACHCLGVFGLSSYTEERDLKEVFGAYGDIDKLCLIYDKQSGHSKGYGFVYFRYTSDAITARKETQGLVLDGRHIRVDYSLTLQPHSPTPGIYKGRHRYSDGYRPSIYRHGDEYGSRSYGRRRSSFDEAYYRRRSDKDYYDECYDRSSRRYSPYSRRH